MQTSKNILLVRPASFGFNVETASSNAFQTELKDGPENLKEVILQEFDAFTAKLKSKGVNVYIIEDTKIPEKPDAIFPNNWISFHADGTLVLYPMFAPNRRLERREDIIDFVKEKFEIKKIIDLSKYENENRFLEGTGSIIFDHTNKIAYACLSPRTEKALFIDLCRQINYKPVYFYSHDAKGQEIYHTNVMMCIGERYVVVCLESITDAKERKLVINSFTRTGHQIIDITFDQVKNYGGNMLEVKTNDDKSLLVMSQSAFDSLTPTQKSELGKYSELLPLPIKTIETIGGGSARCMIAEIFSKPKSV